MTRIVNQTFKGVINLERHFFFIFLAETMMDKEKFKTAKLFNKVRPASQSLENRNPQLIPYRSYCPERMNFTIYF